MNPWHDWTTFVVSLVLLAFILSRMFREIK